MPQRSALEVPRSDSHARPGIALCLSGGGYRSMVFHLGSLWRLNEVGYLPRLDHVASVSGGAVAAAVLGLHFGELDFDSAGVARSFVARVVEPILAFTRHSVDTVAVIGGALTPGSISERLVVSYRDELFGRKTLQDLPERPSFVFNATNIQSGSLWRFSRASMGDERVGEVREPKLMLATAVAASSAVPPFFSPVTIELDSADFVPGSGLDLHCAPYTTDPALSNGGFLDKLALETVWPLYDTILVSDGGTRFREEPEPKTGTRHTYRVLELVDKVERNQRKLQLCDAFRRGDRQGAYWGLRSDISHYELGDALSCPHGRTLELATGPSRLRRLERKAQQQLINWGYAVCDAALRKHVDSKLPAPTRFPYPEVGF